MSLLRPRCVILAIALALAAVWSSASQDLAALEGRVRIFMCPEGDYRLPPDDAPGWTELPLYSHGVAGPLPHDRGIAWITVDFELPCTLELDEPHTLLVANPPDAEEVYANGVLVGGEGTVGPPYALAPKGPHSVAFPGGAFRCGPNRFVFRALLAEENMDLFQGPLYFDKMDRIHVKREDLQESRVATESSVLSALSLLLLFYFFLILSGVVRSEYLLYTAFLGGQLGLFLLDSNLLQRMGLSGIWVPHVQHPLAVLVGFLMLTLVTDITAFPRRAIYWGLTAISGIFLGIYLIVPPISVLYLFSKPHAVFSAVRGLAYLLMGLRAVTRRQPESVPILVGLTAFVVGTRLDAFMGTDWSIYSLLLFSIVMLFVITQRHARLRLRIMEVSSRLLDAQEEERRRLARDIHDGLGQSILAFKLRLQRLLSRTREGAPPTAADLEGLVGEVSSLAEEVRHTARDVRPHFTTDMPLEEALRWYAENFSSRTSMEIFVHDGVAKAGELAPRVKDNLYRIFQEALSNAAKHSGATRFDATLFREGRNVVLIATDNGSGFSKDASLREGIGLSSMRERAEILGGTCRVETRPGQGTTVRVEAPLR